MSRLDYWHPVFPSRRLNARRPIGIKLAGRDIALFRTGDGRLGAIEDKCAHRRMKLSLGRVEDGRVICPYHGWSYAGTGEGESPSAPKLHACVESYDCAESGGVIWVKARGATQELPVFNKEGWDFIGGVFNSFRAPLQLVIDNFSELEHTVTTHPRFGFDPARASEAIVELSSDEETVTAHNRGPSKWLPLDARLTIGLRHGDFFQSNYTFRFDPPRSIVTHWWSDPQTGDERAFSYDVIHYFVPEDDARTQIVTFGFFKMTGPVFRHFALPLRGIFRHRTWQAVEEDAVLMANLTDYSTSLEGMKLSRFDAILGLTRERLERIYTDHA